MGKKVSRFESNHESGRKKYKSKLMNESSSCSKVVRDRLSEVPDELLVLIVSKLSIKEAARTSILSRRWEKLWISYEGNLEFDISNKLRNSAKSNWPLIQYEYVKLMNLILRPLLLGSSSMPLNSLIFRFPYLKADETVEFEFDTLVEFVMARRIRILEFNMYSMETLIDELEFEFDTLDFFSFPVEYYGWIKQPRGLHKISALTCLSFTNVSVSDDTIEYFVSNCPLLERLCVQLSNLLSNPRIISLKLKYLKILDISGMKSLVVSAPNLLSLDYEGIHHEVKLDVSNVPKLVELCISYHIMTCMSGSLSTYIAQFHTLNLSFLVSDIKDKNFSLLTPPNNVVFKNLKHLVFRVTVFDDDESLLGFTSSLVEASPMLEKFALVPLNYVTEDKGGLRKMTTTPTRRQYSQNQRLKVVKLTYFTGANSEVDLLLYFVENFSNSLEQIIIDTSINFTWETSDKVARHARKERGGQLKKHIPPGVDFVLI